MNNYFVGISRTHESNNGFEQDTRDFEIRADSLTEAMHKGTDIAQQHGNEWLVSYIEKE